MRNIDSINLGLIDIKYVPKLCKRFFKEARRYENRNIFIFRFEFNIYGIRYAKTNLFCMKGIIK